MSSRVLKFLAPALLGFALAAATSASAMTFRLVPLGQGNFCGRNCVEVIAAEGEIDNNTPEEFIAFASRSAGTGEARNVLFLDSPGGNVVGALQLGKVFRRLGTAIVIARVLPGGDNNSVIVSGRCMSACVYAFMGGRKRVVPPESEVGIHRMFRRETESNPVSRSSETHMFYAPDSMVGALAQYSGSMGISPQLVAMAERVDPATVHIVTRSELLRWHLGTPRF